MQTVTSADGTRIAYDRLGDGPPVIMVAGAFSYRRYPGQVKLAERLAQRFTVFNYDRRGRGDSTDTQPYSVEREVEDLAALVETAGGEAAVWGLSSGAALALRAAASGMKITRLALHEPPFSVEPDDPKPPADLVPHLNRLLADGRRGDAVRYFMVEAMGAPGFVVTLLKLMPGAWSKLTAVANTLPYDALLTNEFRTGRPLVAADWSSVTMPTLVLVGTESPAFFRHTADNLVDVLPYARLEARKGLGHTKALSVNTIAPVLIDFFANTSAPIVERARSEVGGRA